MKVKSEKLLVSALLDAVKKDNLLSVADMVRMIIIDLLHAQYVKENIGDEKVILTDLAHAQYLLEEVRDDMTRNQIEAIKELVDSLALSDIITVSITR